VPVLVRCAEIDLTAAVDALVQNVFAHTPDGTGMRITVTPAAELVVADEGPGFDVDSIGRGVGSGRSSGLGLDIARRTAEAAGGAMSVVADGSGATVTLSFSSAPLPS
jgi:signal transduction histidine kinase